MKFIRNTSFLLALTLCAVEPATTTGMIVLGVLIVALLILSGYTSDKLTER